MSTRVAFKKMVASGNDFVLLEAGSKKSEVRGQRSEDRGQRSEGRALSSLAKKMCDRKYGIGADGLLVMETSKTADARMRIFNADGSEAQMCGNGARCAALWVNEKLRIKDRRLKIETKAGLLRAEVSGEQVRIQLTDPKDVRLHVPITVNNRPLKVHFINTGVPHTIIFVAGIELIDVDGLGRLIRHHRYFKPAGTNVDFVQVSGDDLIRVRTYERGVEAETLACGTGSVAAAIMYSYQLPVRNRYHIKVLTQGGEVLSVYFEKKDNAFINVWLEGKARNVFEGGYYV
ncbi:MAG: diaminopimelate epimerase [Candidatus Omnitrophota bacterium]